METITGNDAPSLSLLESVRCLGCGGLYSKPSRGGTVDANPGCPDCGYVGWLSASIPLSAALSRRRSGVGRLQDRFALSR